ncbi:hypothetical protein FA95DRAFT_1451343, partial [Auriscalpium vulgare]
PLFPCAEAYLTGGYMVHDCVVVIQEPSGHSHSFLICFQYASDLPVNRTLLSLYPEFQWRGDLLVMRQTRRYFVAAMNGARFDGLAESAI